MTVEALLGAPQYRRAPAAKEPALVAGLAELTAWHRARCAPYDRLLRAFWPQAAAPRSLEEVPWVPVSLFKSHELSSVPPSQAFKTLLSSGTTGSEPSRVVLDRETAGLQSRALAGIMTTLLGPARPTDGRRLEIRALSPYY